MKSLLGVNACKTRAPPYSLNTIAIHDETSYFVTVNAFSLFIGCSILFYQT